MWTRWFSHATMCPKDEGMTHSVGPLQFAPTGAVWSRSALVAHAYLSQNLGFYNIYRGPWKWFPHCLFYLLSLLTTIWLLDDSDTDSAYDSVLAWWQQKCKNILYFTGQNTWSLFFNKNYMFIHQRQLESMKLLWIWHIESMYLQWIWHVESM